MFLHKPREEEFVKVEPLQKVITLPTLKDFNQYGTFLDPRENDVFEKAINKYQGKFTTVLKMLHKAKFWQDDEVTLLSYTRQLYKQRKNPVLNPEQRILIDQLLKSQTEVVRRVEKEEDDELREM